MDCSIGEKMFETEVLWTDDHTPYISYKDRPIQLTSQQAYDLEQFELYRTPVTHDRNGYYADDLDAGDNIRLDGEIWTVVLKNDYTIRLSNSEKTDPDNVQNIYGKWQEKLTQLGFEFIPQSREIETPVFAEPAETPKPEPGDLQLTLFGEPEPVTQKEPKTRTKKQQTAISLTCGHFRSSIRTMQSFRLRLTARFTPTAPRQAQRSKRRLSSVRQPVRAFTSADTSALT